jgi:hypothetical protein
MTVNAWQLLTRRACLTLRRTAPSPCSPLRSPGLTRRAARQCFVVATLVSKTPAEPFLFRNYEHPAASQRLAEQARSRRAPPAAKGRDAGRAKVRACRAWQGGGRAV